MFLGKIVDRENLLVTVASPSSAADSPGQAAQAVFCGVESRITGLSTAGVDTHTPAIVVAALIQGPRGASSHNNRLGLIIVPQVGNVSIGILLTSDKVLVQIQVQCVGLPVVRSPSVPGARGLVVKLNRHVGTVVVTKDPIVAAANIVHVVVLIRVDQPDPGDTQRTDTVVKVEIVEAGSVVRQAHSSASLVGVIIQICVLVSSLAAESSKDRSGALIIQILG